MKIEAVDIQQNSDGQAIRLPEAFRINDNKVYSKKTENAAANPIIG
ncbi:MAG: hypothetical protein M3040_09265 [Bacteroidota bacterium]|nr:hypothetical protein [Bacteroidota bacterium]